MNLDRLSFQGHSDILDGVLSLPFTELLAKTLAVPQRDDLSIGDSDGIWINGGIHHLLEVIRQGIVRKPEHERALNRFIGTGHLQSQLRVPFILALTWSNIESRRMFK